MSTRAPDKMPTQTIRLFIETAKADRNEWARDEKAARQRLRTAEERVKYYDRHITEYEGWLNQRLEDEVTND